MAPDPQIITSAMIEARIGESTLLNGYIPVSIIGADVTDPDLPLALINVHGETMSMDPRKLDCFDNDPMLGPVQDDTWNGFPDFDGFDRHGLF